jgi:hypothetical protein
MSTNHPKGIAMKDRTAIILLCLFALLCWNAFDGHGGGLFLVDGDLADGPLETLLGLAFAGGGILLAGFILLLVGGILAVTFAGVGIVCIGSLAFAAIVVALAVAPFLLPLLLLLALVWYLASRARRQPRAA